MLVLATAVAAALTLTGPDSASSAARVDVQLDNRRNEIVVKVGPFRVPANMPMHDMDMSMMQQWESLVGAFDWPQNRLYHGVKLAVVDARNNLLPRRLLHHTYMVNFGRRQLVYPIMERSFSFGEETADITTPATIGMPMRAGQRMGIVVMWNNETGHDIDSAYVRYTFELNPEDQRPAALRVMPFFVDSHMTVGGRAGYDIPPGGRTVTTEFTVPISGRLIAASGHLHDHALDMRLEDGASGRTLVTVRALRDAGGDVSGVSRELPGLWGRGPHLVAGHPYRLVVRYDNPTPDTLAGAMGMMGGLFVPDHRGEWPAVDTENADWRADIAGMAGATQMLAGRR